PHLPFTAPDRYWDMYSDAEVEEIDRRIGQWRQRSPNTSAQFYHNWYEIRSYGGVSGGPKKIRENAELVRKMTHGYLASISYADAQLGRLLDTLDDPNGDGDRSDSLNDDTIIVVV